MTVDEILGKLAAIGPARRGQITEQWYEKAGKNGKRKRQGPYYVWTRYDDGRKITERVPAADIDRAKDELARGEEVNELFREFFRAKEAEACGGGQKKTPATMRGSAASNSVRRSRKSGAGSARGMS